MTKKAAPASDDDLCQALQSLHYLPPPMPDDGYFHHWTDLGEFLCDRFGYRAGNFTYYRRVDALKTTERPFDVVLSPPWYWGPDPKKSSIAPNQWGALRNVFKTEQLADLSCVEPVVHSDGDMSFLSLLHLYRFAQSELSSLSPKDQTDALLSWMIPLGLWNTTHDDTSTQRLQRMLACKQFSSCTPSDPGERLEHILTTLQANNLKSSASQFGGNILGHIALRCCKRPASKSSLWPKELRSYYNDNHTGHVFDSCDTARYFAAVPVLSDTIAVEGTRITAVFFGSFVHHDSDAPDGYWRDRLRTSLESISSRAFAPRLLAGEIKFHITTAEHLRYYQVMAHHVGNIFQHSQIATPIRALNPGQQLSTDDLVPVWQGVARLTPAWGLTQAGRLLSKTTKWPQEWFADHGHCDAAQRDAAQRMLLERVTAACWFYLSGHIFHWGDTDKVAMDGSVTADGVASVSESAQKTKADVIGHLLELGAIPPWKEDENLTGTSVVTIGLAELLHNACRHSSAQTQKPRVRITTRVTDDGQAVVTVCNRAQSEPSSDKLTNIKRLEEMFPKVEGAQIVQTSVTTIDQDVVEDVKGRWLVKGQWLYNVGLLGAGTV